MKAAAAQVLPDAKLTASEQRAVPGEGARLVTTLTRHPGGATVQVHARIDESFTLVYDAIVTRGGAATALPTAVGAGAAVAEQVVETGSRRRGTRRDAEFVADNLTAGANLGAGFAKWSPDSGETMHDRLGTIVGGAMGYEPEDLPWEVPLIELGLDSLMAVRIKNRVEYDFDLPPIQLTAVRDANLYAVEKLIEYAIEHRDEVEQLHEHQKTQTRRDRRRAGRADGGRRRRRARRQPAPRNRPRLRRRTLRCRRRQRIRRDREIPPPPTEPTQSASARGRTGPASRGRGSAQPAGRHRGAGRRCAPA